MKTRKLQALRTEWRSRGFGPLLYEEVCKLASQVFRKFPPSHLATSGTWDAESLTDACHDVVEALLTPTESGATQMGYCLERAQDDIHFDNLVRLQSRRVAAARVQRTVVDNILERSRDLLRDEGFQLLGSRAERFTRPGSSEVPRDPTETEIRDAAAAFLAVPRRRQHAGPRERAPRVYENADLRRGLLLIAESLPAGFSLTDLRRVLERVLTPWLPSSLETRKEWVNSRAPERQDEFVMVEAAHEIVRELDDRQRLVLLRKLSNQSDSAIARELGLKARQSVAAISKAVQIKIRERLNDLDMEEVQLVLDEIARILIDGTTHDA